MDLVACSKLGFRLDETLLCPLGKVRGPAGEKPTENQGFCLQTLEKTQICFQINCYDNLERLNLGNEPMYLHLLYLTDTICCALGPGDTKNDEKTTSRSTHRITKYNHEFGHEMIPRQLNLSNESIFPDLAYRPDTISYVPGPGDA